MSCPSGSRMARHFAADCAILPPETADYRTLFLGITSFIPPITLYSTIKGGFSHARPDGIAATENCRSVIKHTDCQTGHPLRYFPPAAFRQIADRMLRPSRTSFGTCRWLGQDNVPQTQTMTSIWSAVSRPFVISSARAASGSVVKNRTRRSSSARENDT